MYGTNPGEFNFPFQFYQTFSSIYYNEIGLKLNLSQIFVMKLMSGCGKGKYLTKICWKLSIFDSKALISCIFPKNIINFCNFPKIYVCTMFLIKAFFPETWKRPKNVHSLPRIVYFKSPSDLSSFFQWKRLLKGCSELIFIFSLQNLYLHNNFNQKIVHKVV